MTNQTEIGESFSFPPILGPYLLPVGIPMGRLSQDGQQKRYLLRKAGLFHVLNETEHLLFATAQACLPREDFVSQFVQSSGLGENEVRAAVAELVKHGVLLELSGDPQSDRLRMDTLRLIPRAVSIGCLGEALGLFSLLAPDGKGMLTVDADLYALWVRADGRTSLGAMISETSNDTGKTVSYLWKRCCSLVPDLVRARYVVIDS